MQHVAALVAPRLAVMVHAATNLPGSLSKELQRVGMYVKVAVHRQGKLPSAADTERTHPTLQVKTACCLMLLKSIVKVVLIPQLQLVCAGRGAYKVGLQYLEALQWFQIRQPA